MLGAFTRHARECYRSPLYMYVIQRYFITSEILLKLNLCLLYILQCGTSKVESDKEKAEMFSHFILPNMEELAS